MNDELVSISHLLLNELECVTESLYLTEGHDREDVEDARAVIESAKEILSRYPI